MRRTARRSRHRENPTHKSLTDIAFGLLITLFALTGSSYLPAAEDPDAPAAEMPEEMATETPQRQPNPDPEEHPPLLVTLGDDGELTCDGRRVTEAELVALIEAHPGRPVVLRYGDAALIELLARLHRHAPPSIRLRPSTPPTP